MNPRASSSHSDNGQIWSTATLIVIAIAIGVFGRLGGLENLAYDYFQRYQYKSASDQILLVTVDSRAESQKEIWSGSKFGELAATLNNLGAKLVVATQPIHLPDVADEAQIRALEKLQKQAQLVASSTGQIDPLAGQIIEYRAQFDQRQALVQQFADSNNILLSTHVSNFAVEDRSINDCKNHAVNMQAIDSGAMPNVTRVRHLTLPPADVCSAVRAIGVSNFQPDDDGVLRSSELLINTNGVFLPSLALSIEAAASNATTGDANHGIIVATANALALGENIVNTGKGLQVLNRYYTGTLDQPAFNIVSASSILSGNADSASVRDRIILIGESTSASMPGLATPIDAHMSPLVATASNLSNLIERDFLLRPDWLPMIETGAMLGILLIALLWVPAMPTIGAALMGLILGILVLSIQAWFLVSEGIWIQLATASVLAVVAVWVQHVFRLINHSKRARRPRAASNYSALGGTDQSKLDLEFSVLRQQAPTTETKEKMYEIAMIHGKAKEFARAEKVLAYIANLDPNYKDVTDLLRKLSGARQKAKTKRKVATSSGPLDRRTLGRYEIDRVLGRGAMATVYLGRDPAINRKVAIKTVALAKEFDEEELQDAKLQFRREAESAGRLNHPNIIAIYDAGEDDDVSYLAMEYFEGVSLLEHTTMDNLMPAKWVMELAARAAEALDYAHRQNVVHRDIKPANLMYHAATDTLKLTDFGIARLTDNSRTKTGIILGTPSYMSPEQLSASGVTGQSDLYSLGITMYQLLTGSAPFRADSIPKLMDKILNEDHAPVKSLRNDLPTCVDAIIGKTLSKDPANRFTSGREMALALRECAKQF